MKQIVFINDKKLRVQGSCCFELLNSLSSYYIFKFSMTFSLCGCHFWKFFQTILVYYLVPHMQAFGFTYACCWNSQWLIHQAYLMFHNFLWPTIKQPWLSCLEKNAFIFMIFLTKHYLQSTKPGPDLEKFMVSVLNTFQVIDFQQELNDLIQFSCFEQ